jgi:hypothetical protein
MDALIYSDAQRDILVFFVDGIAIVSTALSGSGTQGEITGRQA